MKERVAQPNPEQPTSSPPEAKLSSLFQHFNHEAARREGWDLIAEGHYADGDAKIQIQTTRGTSPFREDRDAWKHVVDEARKYSQLHRDALDLIDRREQMAIFTVHGFW
ncbi:hypothetical protein [Beijerinckia indica]|uniref:Uncharacterized protein n=1 Tax=Beijerinckia indica subsp. indica (strain ATCC 9039 / DSM 1715 / NCIMB 8712) TaxID=395963 RepID=B2IL85_BEII9|nr:hypothetical protein [Beijerinckia indica]ACB97285.1 hypothetical protein Bind_3734 [Beijerinckia indica subsp. indica ATCC 9039]